MISMRELINNKLKTSNIKEAAEIATENLINQGYVYNEFYGWERPEILEMFGLDPNMKGIPAKLYDEYDYKENKTSLKDEYGRKTGELKIERAKVKTGRQFWGAIENWFAYKKYKQDNYKKFAAERYGREAIDSLEDYYI